MMCTNRIEDWLPTNYKTWNCRLIHEQNNIFLKKHIPTFSPSPSPSPLPPPPLTHPSFLPCHCHLRRIDGIAGSKDHENTTKTQEDWAGTCIPPCHINGLCQGSLWRSDKDSYLTCIPPNEDDENLNTIDIEVACWRNMERPFAVLWVLVIATNASIPFIYSQISGHVPS